MLRFGFIKENVKDVMSNWLKLYDKTLPALELYISTQMDKHKFSEIHFPILARYLEAYYQGYMKKEKGKRKSLKDVLEEILPSLKSVYSFDKKDQWIKDVRNIRNYLTHYDKDNIEKKLTEEELKTLYNRLPILYRQLEAIFQLKLLKDLGFDDEKIKGIIRNNTELSRKLKYFETNVR